MMLDNDLMLIRLFSRLQPDQVSIVLGLIAEATGSDPDAIERAFFSVMDKVYLLNRAEHTCAPLGANDKGLLERLTLAKITRRKRSRKRDAVLRHRVLILEHRARGMSWEWIAQWLKKSNISMKGITPEYLSRVIRSNESSG